MGNATRVTATAEELTFFSDGLRLHAIYHLPAGEPIGGVVYLPGSRVTKETPFYGGYVRGLVAEGVAVLLIDYRGWGRSEGSPGTLFPLEQVADARNAITYLSTRDELAGRGLGLFGVSMGGAHAVYAAGFDDRISAAVAVLSPMDGEGMLRRTRREYEWVELQQLIRQDRRQRVLNGSGKAVDHLSPPTPERARTTAVAADPPPPIPIECLEALAEYRPIDVVDRIAPRAMLWFAATEDPVCPIDLVRRAYDRAGSPKRLVEIPSAEHYGTYVAHQELILAESVRWFRDHLKAEGPRVRDEH